MQARMPMANVFDGEELEPRRGEINGQAWVLAHAKGD